MSRKNSSRALVSDGNVTPKFTDSALRWFLFNSKEVSVTYELRKSANLVLVDNGFFLGGTLIDLNTDRQSDVFFKSSSPYSCTSVDEKLLVEIQSDGLSGDNWELKVLVNGQQLDEFPISEVVNSSGRADHHQEHLF